jgi:hypothetical protein
VGLVLGGGGGGTFDALPMPLGSLTELLTPPTLPGPAGMPLTPVVLAPAEPGQSRRVLNRDCVLLITGRGVDARLHAHLPRAIDAVMRRR